MDYLDKEDIIGFNKETIERHGGNFVPPFNLLKEAALDYLVEVVEHGELFGEAMYPTLHQKAAIYLYNICQNHISTDGNKRTALNAMDTFIRLNGYALKKDLKPVYKNNTISISSNLPDTRNAVLEQFILEVASGQHSLELVTNWLKLNTEKID